MWQMLTLNAQLDATGALVKEIWSPEGLGEGVVLSPLYIIRCVLVFLPEGNAVTEVLVDVISVKWIVVHLREKLWNNNFSSNKAMLKQGVKLTLV